MTAIKLTKAQRKWLEELAECKDELTCVPTYPAHRKLVEHGFAQERIGKLFGFAFATITPAGREWLDQHQRKQ